MVSNFQPAVHQKTGTIGRLIANISRTWQKASKDPDPSKTTEQGAASAASPSTYRMSLYSLRYERRDTGADVRQMIIDDPRARKSTLMFAAEATRGGYRITRNNPQKRGPGSQREKIFQECAEQVLRIANPEVTSWAWMGVTDGEVFCQLIVHDDELVDMLRMPSVAMERNTDDNDHFIDPYRAFSQVDVTTNQEVATFPLWQICHFRNEHIDGDKYGTSSLIAGRRLRRLLELEEDGAVVGRLSRAYPMRLWTIGTPEHNPPPAGQTGSIEDFKERNGFNAGRRELFNPNEIGTDAFGNGLVDCKVLEGAPRVHEVGDIAYLQNVYSMALPTPASLMNLDPGAINRDVLKDQYSQWLRATSQLSNGIANDIIRRAMDLQLLLKGILPESMPYEVSTTLSSPEMPGDVVGYLTKLRQNTVGTGANAIPDPAISKRALIAKLATEVTGIENVDAEIEEIEAELEQMMRDYSKILKETGLTPQSLAPEETGTDTPAPTASKNGHASKNGKGSATAARQ